MATTNKLNFFRFFFISILGVLLHFTYEWSNDNPAVGLFSAVNESTWEHLKLIFFPMLLLTMMEFLWAHIKDKPCRNIIFQQGLSVSCQVWLSLWSVSTL